MQDGCKQQNTNLKFGFGEGNRRLNNNENISGKTLLNLVA